MEVYLVQHGESKPESEDVKRPLTDKGRAEVEYVALYIAGLELQVTRIFHSSRLRAKQTAEIFAQHLVPAPTVLEQKGLEPSDDPHQTKRLIQQEEKSLMLVGHLPHLSRLASLLILGDQEKEAVRFRMGGVVCLGRSNDGWLIDWSIIPKIVRQIGEPGNCSV
jgi:phosphohistidine phosphatase